MVRRFFERLERDLGAPIEVRGFGSGWFSGFFALLFAICGFALPVLDKLFGTFHLPPGRWPADYGVPEKVPAGYWAQAKYPFRRRSG